MKNKAFPEANFPEKIQEKADRMNLDENLVPEYTVLPLPFTDDMTLAEKNAAARKTLDIFTRELYGEIPPRCKSLNIVETSSGSAFNDKAERKEFDIICSENNISKTLHMLLYIPAKRSKSVPCFLGGNFNGNISTADDPQVTFHPFKRYADPSPWLDDIRCDINGRGEKSERFCFEKVIDAGFASATFCFCDACPDHPDGYEDSIMPMFYSKEEYNSGKRRSGAISAWAWGLMRCIDALETVNAVNPRKIILHGHSRMGKTAIWTGVNDPRVAMTVSNCSGTCGAKMSRRYFGESMEWLDNWRKYWFVPSFEKFSRNDTAMPFDQHQLMALIAPRLLYVASGSADFYADPKGEFIATVAASQAWGKDGIAPDSLCPAPGSGIGDRAVRYYMREGEHAMTSENWDEMLKFAGKHLL